MKIAPMNMSKNSFKGLLTISGPNKDKEIIVNTDNISTIVKHSYMDKKEDTVFGIGSKAGSFIAMNDSTIIHIFSSPETVIDAYKKAKGDNEYKIETKFDPVIERKLLDI